MSGLAYLTYTYSAYGQDFEFTDTESLNVSEVNINSTDTCDLSITSSCTTALPLSPFSENLQENFSEPLQQQEESFAADQPSVAEPPSDQTQQLGGSEAPLQEQQQLPSPQELQQQEGEQSQTDLQEEQGDTFGINQQSVPLPNEGFLSSTATPNIKVNLNDTDGDDLLDTWETKGIDLDSDGVAELDLPSLGANPLHKDLFVEVDFMQFHKPFNQTIRHLIGNFSSAPVTNPDNTTGINLHLEVDEELPHQHGTNQPELILLKASNFGTSAQRANPATILAKSLVYHYAVFAHNQTGTTSSGVSNGINSMEFLVTLGGSPFSDPASGHRVGTVDQQEGTFMHELGHNLNLHHGGIDDINCKPNYLSVMSYSRQFSDLISNRPLDYSRSLLSQLNEAGLDENLGIGSSTPLGLQSVYGPSPIRTNATGIALDWNRDGDTIDVGIVSDINEVPPPRRCDVSPNEMLNGHDDWKSIIFSQPARTLKAFVNVTSATINSIFGVDVNSPSGAALASENILAASGVELTPIEQMPPELSMDDVRLGRLTHLESINEAINSLPDTAFPAPSPAPTPVTECDPASPLLRKGSVSDKVTELQTHLTTLGYGQLLGAPGIDGIFGPLTEDAVRQYQTDKQLLVDGKVGPETWGSICSSINNQQVQTDQVTDPKTLLSEMTDPETSELANLLLSDNLAQAIDVLLAIRSLVDSSSGGSAEDDLIISTSAQQQVLPIIDNAILAFEKQGPGYDAEGNFRSSIPPSSNSAIQPDSAPGFFGEDNIGVT